MQRGLSSIRFRLDRFGILLSGLCAVHCLAGIALVSVFGFGSVATEGWLAPEIHRIGLGLAIAVAAATLGIAAVRHGRRLPLAIGACGIAVMTGALFVPHGLPEALLTIAGVALVAFAHIRNLRQTA